MKKPNPFSALNLFGDIALISPAHICSVFARLANPEIRVYRADSDDDEEEDDQNGKPWWQVQNIWGEKLPAPVSAGSTAIIPVTGVITSGLPALYRAWGYADTDEIGLWVRAAAEDPDVEQIILSIDSPGGMVTGTPELADEIDAATAVKPVLAHTKGMMDSAAYWIGSQANAIFCTPSADVGCIGVYQMHYDFSGYLEKFGVTAEMIKSGDLKGTGHPDIPLSKEQRADIQKSVDLIGVAFRAAVKSKRVLVEDDSMRGQSFIGTEAAERNLVAGLRTLDSLL